MAKRRLPLLQPAQADVDEPPRSPWQWVGFGAAAIFVTWVPLSILVGAAAARILSRASSAGEGVGDGAELGRAVLFTSAVTSAAYAIELAAGALAGGYLVGRWGPSGVGVREGALAGLAAAVALAVMVVFTFGARVSASPGAVAGVILVGLVSPPMAAWGALLGLRRRARGGLPPLD